MRRISSSLLTLICFTTIASAQNPVVVNLAPAPGGGAALVVSLASAEHIVARMMSFDRDRDGKIAVSELPERMQGLVARADTSGDGTLDNAEIAKLANAPPAQEDRAFINPGGYTFGDQVGLSSRAHVEGALEDLRLPDATKEKALAAARWFMDGLETNAAADLLNEMKPMLTKEQLADFRTTLAKGGVAGGHFTFSRPGNGAVPTVITQSAVEVHVARLSLPFAQSLHAKSALERYRSRLRLGDEERAALVEEMKGILSDEERDNFRAALERRPLVKAGGSSSFREFVKVGVAGTLQRDMIAPTPRVPEPGR
jgi:hypothetical protein